MAFVYGTYIQLGDGVAYSSQAESWCGCSVSEAVTPQHIMAQPTPPSLVSNEPYNISRSRSLDVS